MAKYTAAYEEMAAGLSEFVPFMINPEYCLDELLVSGGAVVGDIVEVDGMAGVVTRACKSGEAVACVVRGAVINGDAYEDGIDDAKATKFKAQGCKLIGNVIRDE